MMISKAAAPSYANTTNSGAYVVHKNVATPSIATTYATDNKLPALPPPTPTAEDVNKMIAQIIRLLHKHSCEIHLSSLHSMYEEEYGSKLVYKGKLKTWLENHVPKVAFAFHKGGVFITLDKTGKRGGDAGIGTAATEQFSDGASPSSSHRHKKARLDGGIPTTLLDNVTVSRYVLRAFRNKFGNNSWPTKYPRINLALSQFFGGNKDGGGVIGGAAGRDYTEWYDNAQRDSVVGEK